MISNRNKLYGGLLGLLMLAGCGSGSDTSDSATTKATPEQSDPLSQASPGTGSGTLTTKAPAALGSQDISAELLSSLLMQGTTGNGKVDRQRSRIQFERTNVSFKNDTKPYNIPYNDFSIQS